MIRLRKEVRQRRGESQLANSGAHPRTANLPLIFVKTEFDWVRFVEISKSTASDLCGGFHVRKKEKSTHLTARLWFSVDYGFGREGGLLGLLGPMLTVSTLVGPGLYGVDRCRSYPFSTTHYGSNLMFFLLFCSSYQIFSSI